MLYIAITILVFLIAKPFIINYLSKNKISKLMSESKNILFVDVRQPNEFAGGSAPKSINIPVGEVSQRIAEFQGKDAVVVFCKSGTRAGMAATILRQNGIENVINGGTWENVAAQVR
jgi:phage shock protein E